MGATVDLEKVFRMCDETQKGYLNNEDIKVAVLYLFGYKPLKYEVTQLMASERSFSQQQGMKLDTFRRLMKAKIETTDDDQQIREKFKMFDVKYQGYLTLDDVKQAFKLVAPHISDATVSSCYKAICSDKCGKLSYHNFQLAMKSRQGV